MAEVLVHHRGEIVDISILEKINAEEQFEVFACGVVEELRHGTLRPWLVGLSNVESKCVEPDRDGLVDVELSMSRARVHCPNLEKLSKLDESGRVRRRTYHIVGKHGFGMSGMSGEIRRENGCKSSLDLHIVRGASRTRAVDFERLLCIQEVRSIGCVRRGITR